MKRKLIVALAIVSALFAAVVIVPDRAAAGERKTMTGGFDVGPGGFQGMFNPLAATSGMTWLSYYYEPLVTYDAKLEKIVGALAESWTVSPDGLEYTFNLQPDVKFHDGSGMTAADVVYSIDLVKEPRSGSVYAARIKSIDNVAALDPKTVRITLSKPDSGILDHLVKAMILPKHILEKIPLDDLPKSDWWFRNPVGTGPFKFVRYETDRFVELAAFDDYRLGRPKLDSLINRYFANPAAAVAALRAGDIDFTYVEPEDAKTFSGNAAYRVIEGPSLVLNYIGFNMDAPYWKDVRVRRALMHAIDRQAIVDSLYGGAAVIANSGYVAANLLPDGLDAYAYDPAKAKALLDEAGWDSIKPSEPITLITYYTTPLATNVTAAMQAMLAQVGIAINIRQVDTPTYNATVLTPNADWKQFPLVYAGLQNGPDAGYINAGLNEAQIPPDGVNLCRVRIPELSNAFNAAMSEIDQDLRIKKFQEVARIMNEQVAWGTMWVANRYGVVSSKAVDFVWTPAPGGGPFESNAHLWDLK